MSTLKVSAINLNSGENTKISIAGNDLDLLLSANGKNGITVDSNGRVGVNITSPTSNLHVFGTANITSNLVVNGGTLYVDALSQEVGIGITQPTSNLHVIGSANITGNLTLVDGNISSQTIRTTGNVIAVGFVQDDIGDVRDLPINNQTASYLIVPTDAGKTVSITTGNVFVPNAIFTAGQAVSVYNNSAASITVTQNSSVTMYLAGTATTGNRTLAQRGIATVLCVAANTFVISGAGLT